jgi:hypothetical protein
MFIAHEPQNAIQAPSGAAWFELSARTASAINMALLTELSPHASTIGLSGDDLPRDGSWGPAEGYSLNWHNQRGEILAPSFGP